MKSQSCFLFSCTVSILQIVVLALPTISEYDGTLTSNTSAQVAANEDLTFERKIGAGIINFRIFGINIRDYQIAGVAAEPLPGLAASTPDQFEMFRMSMFDGIRNIMAISETVRPDNHWDTPWQEHIPPVPGIVPTWRADLRYITLSEAMDILKTWGIAGPFARVRLFGPGIGSVTGGGELLYCFIPSWPQVAGQQDCVGARSRRVFPFAVFDGLEANVTSNISVRSTQ